MSKKSTSITAASAALLALGGMTLSAPLFAAAELPQGYQVADAHGKSGEAKCGEGKCGEKSGEAKCGEAKCGEGKGGEKAGEAKCGEGKCGS